MFVISCSLSGNSGHEAGPRTARTLFEGKRGSQPVAAHSAQDRLYGEIERLQMELDWLKKSQGSACHDASHLDRQRRQGRFNCDKQLLRLIDEEYTRHPFYGSRKMVVYLGRCGYSVNRKRAQRKVFPYLLRGVPIDRSNQVLSWRISNSMEAVFCVDCLEEALRAHGKPEVFNSDQGSQFTSESFTGVHKRESITIQAWMGAAERLTTYFWSACGAASSTRMCTSRAIARWTNC